MTAAYLAPRFSWRSPSLSRGPERCGAAHGYLRGADLWHVACALFLADAARTEFAFLSRDKAQRKVAGRLGFSTP